jgi:hypothetical protein
MHSTVSTCPNVGAICYPLSLGVTKEIMSQGPHVEDMESVIAPGVSLGCISREPGNLIRMLNDVKLGSSWMT